MIITDEKILRQPSSKVKLKEGFKIANKLISILKEREDGLGLSAIQIGIPKQVFVTYVDRKPNIYINPCLFKKEYNELNYIYTKEGCLSLPNEFYTIKRFSSIKFISHGKVGVLEDVESIVFQHEYDHLQGILIKDRSENVNTNDLLNNWNFIDFSIK